MKVAFTTTGDDTGAPLDPRFGRAPRFLVYELEAETFTLVENQNNVDASVGAGIQSAEKLARLGVKALITGHCGPKAFRVLKAAGIRVYNSDAPTVAESLARYRAGQLSEAASADVQGHWA